MDTNANTHDDEENVLLIVEHLLLVVPGRHEDRRWCLPESQKDMNCHGDLHDRSVERCG